MAKLNTMEAIKTHIETIKMITFNLCSLSFFPCSRYKEIAAAIGNTIHTKLIRYFKRNKITVKASTKATLDIRTQRFDFISATPFKILVQITNGNDASLLNFS